MEIFVPNAVDGGCNKKIDASVFVCGEGSGGGELKDALLLPKNRVANHCLT